MLLAFCLLFVALPVLDVLSLIKAGDLWGFWPTVGLVVGTGIVGTAIVRHQGLSIGQQVRQSLNAGRLPVVEAFDGACVLVAGGLLLFPGLASDVLAVALLLPPLRALLRRSIAWRLRRSGQVVVWRHEFPGPAAGASSPGGPSARRPGEVVIEGEFEPVEPPPTVDVPARLPMPRSLRPDNEN